MEPERWQQIERLYYAALERAPDEHAAFLAEACAGDESLRREVASFIAAGDRIGSFMEPPADVVVAATPATAPPPSMIGQTLTHYRIVSPLGSGGMGEVYLATDIRLGRKVAVKLLPAEFTANPERVRRFEQEARAASALNHPNIITIFDIDSDAAGRFIVMELVVGRTLRDVLAQGPAVDSLLHLGGQMAKALSVAHAAGITHRDIKPENIMVRDDGYVKILDFGLARLLPAPDSEVSTGARQTTPGILLGTVAYMSPEQARGETAGHASDIFALGMVFYELATGQHPFKTATLIGTLQAITTQTPQRPSRLNPEISVALETLILRMLEKAAGRRPTAQEVDQALNELTGQRSSGQLQRAAKPAGPRHTVGREKEQAELRSGFASALNGRGQLLCVAGEPGIGKTTLVEDFLTELAAENQSTIARGRCSERLAGTEAYLPLLEALENLLQSGSNPAAAQMLKQLAPTWYAQVVPLSGASEESARLLAEVKAASQERMKRELGAFLQEVARPRPLVLFFDDLHWADVSTIDLLSFLAGKFDTLKALIVVTYRPSDLLLAKHPFLQIKPDLQARGVCRELLLEFLTEAEIAEYLALEFPGHCFPPEFPKLIHAKTEGSPLFMAHLVRYLRDCGVIANTSGSWTLEQTLPDVERELPESVRGMIERKIAQLGEEDGKLLTAASVQGYEFDSAVVAQVLNLDADEVEERLEKLERVFAFVKLMSESEFPNRRLTLKYRFIHVLYQNALYNSLRATRKTTLSRAVAQTLEDFHGEKKAGVASDLAPLFEAGREFSKAAGYFRIAAEHASQLFAAQEAAALARRGIDALKSLPETPERAQQELGLQLSLGLSLRTIKSFAHEETGRAYARARELCHQIGDSPQLFPILFGLWENYQSQAQLATAMEIVAELLALAGNDSSLLVAAHNVMADNLTWFGDFTTAREHLEKGIAVYDYELHRANVTRFGYDSGMACLGFGSIVLWHLGYPDQALKMSDASCRLATKLAHPLSLAYTTILAAWFHRLNGSMQTAREVAETAIETSAKYDIALFLAMGKVMRGWALIGQQKTEEGIALAREGIDEFRATGTLVALAWFTGILAEGYIKAGQTEEALTSLAEALEIASRTSERFYEAELLRLKGELLLKSAAPHPPTEAESCFQQAIEIARRQSAKSLELRTAMSLARLWQQQGKIVEARQMLTGIYGWFTEGFDTRDLKDAKALLEELSRTAMTENEA